MIATPLYTTVDDCERCRNCFANSSIVQWNPVILDIGSFSQSMMIVVVIVVSFRLCALHENASIARKDLHLTMIVIQPNYYRLSLAHRNRSGNPCAVTLYSWKSLNDHSWHLRLPIPPLHTHYIPMLEFTFAFTTAKAVFFFLAFVNISRSLLAQIAFPVVRIIQS